jgi:hypothetical protein
MTQENIPILMPMQRSVAKPLKRLIQIYYPDVLIIIFRLVKHSIFAARRHPLGSLLSVM